MRSAIVIAQLVLIALLLFEALYVLRQKPSEMRTRLLIALAATILIVFSDAVELTAPNLETAMAGVCYSYLGVPFAMLETLFFIMTYCGCEPSLNQKIVFSLFVCVFPVMVFTNDRHHLYYSSAVYDRSLPLSPLVLEPGPLYYVFLAGAVLFFVVGMCAAVGKYSRSTTKPEKIRVCCLLGVEASALAGALLSVVPNGYNGTMIGCFLSALLLMILLFKCRLFDILGFAEEYALKKAHSGLIVLNDRNQITYTNETAEQLIKSGLSVEEIVCFPSGESSVEKGSRYFTVVKTDVKWEGTIVSRTVEVIDATESHRTSMELEHEVAQGRIELKHVQRRLIADLADLIEARDSDTGSHARKTCRYTRRILEELRNMGCFATILTDQYCSYLIDAATTHDIGKISVPDSILCKPGKLTADEFETMKQHTTSGSDIIEDTMRGIEDDAYVNIARDVARYHHEKWDGSGYPDGLKAKEIPLAARIVAVADVFEALTSPRCYKEPVDAKTACNIIKQGSGRQFDAVVVTAFLQSFKEDNPRGISSVVQSP